MFIAGCLISLLNCVTFAIAVVAIVATVSVCYSANAVVTAETAAAIYADVYGGTTVVIAATVVLVTVVSVAVLFRCFGGRGKERGRVEDHRFTLQRTACTRTAAALADPQSRVFFLFLALTISP